MMRFAFSTVCASALALGVAAHGEEPPAPPEAVFETLDANHDGAVAGDELSEDQQRFFEQLVRTGDDDSDGELSKDEFTAAVDEDEESPENGDDDRAERDRTERNRPGRRPPQPLFERLDQNQDGTITKDEIPERLPEPMRDRLNGLFDRLNKDALDRDDLRSMRPGPAGPGRGRGGNGLARLDRNHDGKLTREEIPEPLRERFARLFDRLDRDELSIEELVRAGRSWGNSPRSREHSRSEGERAQSDESRRGPGEGSNREDNGHRDMRPGRPGAPGRPSFARGGFAGRGGFGGPHGGGSAFFRVLDSDRDGRLSRDELARAADKFAQLDRNDDGQLEPTEVFGGPGRMAAFGPGRPEFGMRDPGPRERHWGERRDHQGEESGEAHRGPAEDQGREAGRSRGDGAGHRPEGREFARGDEERPHPEHRHAEADRPHPPEGRDPHGDRRHPPQGHDRKPQDSRGHQNLLKQFDRDGDGAISEDEAPRRMKEHFDRLDRNGNGSVTPREFHEAIAEEYGLHEERMD